MSVDYASIQALPSYDELLDVVGSLSEFSLEDLGDLEGLREQIVNAFGSHLLHDGSGHFYYEIDELMEGGYVTLCYGGVGTLNNINDKLDVFTNARDYDTLEDVDETFRMLIEEAPKAEKQLYEVVRHVVARVVGQHE